MKKCPKEIHFSCKNCRRISKVSYRNKVKLCSGMVKVPKIPHDLFRFCICRDENKSSFDLMYEELISMIHILASLLMSHTCEQSTDKKN